MEAEKATVPSVTKSDLDWVHKRIDYVNEDLRAMRSKLRLLVRILVDKKIIGVELAKTFAEAKEISPEDMDRIVAWFQQK